MAAAPTEDLALFEAIYDTALFPEHFDTLAAAWDETFGHQVASADAPARLAELEAQGLRRHFARAGQIFAATDTRQSQDLEQFIESQRTASMLTAAGGRILAANVAATQAFGVVAGDDIAAVPLEANSESRVRAAVARLASADGTRDNAVALSGVRQDNGKVFIVVIERMAGDAFSGLREPLFLFRSTLTRWDAQISQLLQSAFDLTEAELAIIELLNDGLRLDEIAQRRGRSEKTVRTQLRNINQKTRTNSQIELMRHVSSLIIMAGELTGTTRAVQSAPVGNDELREGVAQSLDGRDIHYLDQGTGPAVLCFFPTVPPLQHAPWESLLAGASLRRIAVYKPGSGRSAKAPAPLSARQQADDLHQVAQHLSLDTLTLFGHCAGGVAALEFAAAYPDRVRSVVLLDTGAPLQRQAQWDAMPPSASRTFFLSQHAPELLETPHKLVAANFASGAEGRRQTLTYFYDGQGEDLKLLEDPVRHAWACAMLGYCLADTAQLICDVRSWASDWSARALSVAERCPITFIQGDTNQQFPLADVQAFCTQHPNLQATAAPGAAQLTLLTHGELVVQVLRDLACGPARGPAPISD